MKRWVVACGVLCACGAVCPDDKDIDRPLTAGTYVPTERPAECDSTSIKPIDPTRATDQLEVSDDLKTVTETYTRDGKVFKVVYDVTGTQKF
jgi:hypothetical protein